MNKTEKQQLLDRIEELERQLEETEQLVDAIRSGEVDAFAINGEEKSEIYTLQSGDYAYRVLIEEFQEGAINITEQGLVVYTNRYFLELLQQPYENVIGNYLTDFVDSKSLPEFKLILREGLNGKGKGEINLKVKDRVIPVYISLTSLQPMLPTVGIIITDLTGKKKNEGVLLRYQKDLEAKNQELTQSNAELASFAYIASHDLQEPLRKIQTFSSRILEREYDKISDHGKDNFNRMQNAAKRMQTLIEDLLTYSRTNTVERIFEASDLSKMVNEVKDDLNEELQQKNASITVSDNCGVQVIPFQFRQLFSNLISNSLKFARPGIPPEIDIKGIIIKGNSLPQEHLPADKNYCHISFRDNGIGFEQQYSEKIFDLFQRLHTRSEYNGTGIGLAIVKKIVENHRGYISASSEPGSGSTFNIYIPA